MAFDKSKFEMWFLDDLGTPASGTYTDYRNALTWKRWNRRTTGDPGVNVGTLFSDADAVNSGNGSSLYYLKGKYSRTSIGANTLTKDYIVDSTDSIVGANHPQWIYTWVAIQNNGLAGEDAYRVHMLTNQGYQPSVDYKFTENATEYGSLRWMGLIDNTVFNDFVTNGASAFFTANAADPLWKFFPHVSAVLQTQQTQGTENTKYNIWNALGETELVSGNGSRLLATNFPAISQFTNEGERIYLGYNNKVILTGNANYYNLTTTYRPYQVNRWIAVNDYTNSPRAPHHCFDIPAGKTALAIMAKSRDSQDAQLGDDVVNMQAVTNYNWKINEILVKYDYLVI